MKEPLTTVSTPSTGVSPWPSFAPDEMEAVARVLSSGKVNYWTGTEGRSFEAEHAVATGCAHAIALANGTVALELALYALGIGPGDEVITTPRTFIASASAIVMRGATPVLADVGEDLHNISAETIAPHVTPRTRAIIVVHLAGWPCDMDPILALAQKHGLDVIEDCAQASGARYKGRPVGSFGRVAAFSFCQDKIITTGGEGGMLTTNDPVLWEKAWSFKDHGKSYDAVYRRPHAPGFRWLHESFGTNWRLTEMQSAIGRVQLVKLPTWKALRTKNARRIMDALEPFASVHVPQPPPFVEHAFYKLYAFVNPRALKPGCSRDSIIEAITRQGVPAFSGSCSEIYREKAFAGRGPAERLPRARELGETSLMFLVHPTLTEEDVARTCRAIEVALREAGA